MTTRKKMMKNKTSIFPRVAILLFVAFFQLTNATHAHKFYMSICDMEYNPKSKSLEIVVKLFVDDFEETLERETGDPIFIGEENENWKTDEFITSYFQSHFQISQNGKTLTNKFIGKEIDKDYAWVYIEVPNFKVDKSSTLKNSLLIDYFESQTNKVNYKNGQITNSFTLHKHKTEQEF